MKGVRVLRNNYAKKYAAMPHRFTSLKSSFLKA